MFAPKLPYLMCDDDEDDDDWYDYPEVPKPDSWKKIAFDALLVAAATALGRALVERALEWWDERKEEGNDNESDK
jgi:hypothetical protein